MAATKKTTPRATGDGNGPTPAAHITHASASLPGPQESQQHPPLNSPGLATATSAQETPSGPLATASGPLATASGPGFESSDQHQLSTEEAGLFKNLTSLAECIRLLNGLTVTPAIPKDTDPAARIANLTAQLTAMVAIINNNPHKAPSHPSDPSPQSTTT
jgi:hypothetical protein